MLKKVSTIQKQEPVIEPMQEIKIEIPPSQMFNSDLKTFAMEEFQ